MTLRLPSLEFSPTDIDSFLAESKDYLNQYEALISLGTAAQDRQSALALALAVYGWMPRILRSFDISDKEVVQAKQVAAGGAAEFVQKLEQAPVNKSWVGSSKFLHFLNPEVFPIWDSHIACAFGFEKWHQYKSADEYSNYIKKMQFLLQSGYPSVDSMITAIKVRHNYKVGPLRALEFLIFSASRKKKRNDSPAT